MRQRLLSGQCKSIIHTMAVLRASALEFSDAGMPKPSRNRIIALLRKTTCGNPYCHGISRSTL